MAKAFERQQARAPVAIEDIQITLLSPDPTGVGTPSASYRVNVRYSDGSVGLVAGDLVPFLTTAQVDGLLGFMSDMRAKAIAEVLPE